MKLSVNSLMFIFIIGITCCSSDFTKTEKSTESSVISATTEGLAQITNVTTSSEENQYTFNVTIASPDLGCNQYANWWEVIDLNGNLIYRRVLGHSHVEEQPFTRSGGPVSISKDTKVYIRAHMNTTSYGNVVFAGSVADGFSSTTLDVEFAKELEETAPLPSGCAF